VAEAAGGDEEEGEDGRVVADVDEGGGHHGAEAEADVAENEGDTEEEEEDRPGESCLEAVDEGEEDAGEDGGEDERWAGEFVVHVPLFAGRRGAGEREPVVGDGEGGEEEAAEDDLFKERSEQRAEGGDEPDVGGGAEEVVDGDVFGQRDERRDGLGGDGQDDADGDEADDVAAGSVEICVDAFGERTLPHEREDKPGDGEGGEIAEGLGADEKFGGYAGCGCFA